MPKAQIVLKINKQPQPLVLIQPMDVVKMEQPPE
jgi:hypothetical protein